MRACVRVCVCVCVRVCVEIIKTSFLLMLIINKSQFEDSMIAHCQCRHQDI